MFLHIVDDEKFIDSLIGQFEKIVPGESIYLVNIPYPEYELKYIKNTDRVVCATFGTEDYNKYISDDIPYHAILFHNFYMRYKWSLVEEYKIKTQKVWFAWGLDLYQLRKLKHKTLLKKTSVFRKKVNRKIAWNKGKLYGLIYAVATSFEIATNFLYPIINKKAYIDYYLKHFDYMVPVIKEDFELFKKYYKSKESWPRGPGFGLPLKGVSLPCPLRGQGKLSLCF